MLVKSVCNFLIIIMLSAEVHSQRSVTQTIGENCTLSGCVCKPGYTKRNDVCEPLCEGDCLNGVCTAPNTCRCDSGYKLVNSTCQPVCTDPCENGTCTAPETCVCNSGYYKRIYSYTFTVSCEPHCPVGCPLNGYCDAPGRCKCDPGWRLNEFSNRCEAICKYPCGNGICLLPDRCLCALGFEVNYSIQEGDVSGQVCQSISKSSNESSTTTTRNPLETKTTYDYYDAVATTTTTVSYFESSSSFTDVDDVFNATLAEKSWMQQHGLFIWIPLAVIVTVGLMALLVWRRIPMIVINYFKRRSYNVQEAFLKRNASSSYETVHIIPDEKETQIL